MLGVLKVIAWKLHNFLRNLHWIWPQQPSEKTYDIYNEVRSIIIIQNIEYFYNNVTNLIHFYFHNHYIVSWSSTSSHNLQPAKSYSARTSNHKLLV
jgi:hypothetical protein